MIENTMGLIKVKHGEYNVTNDLYILKQLARYIHTQGFTTIFTVYFYQFYFKRKYILLLQTQGAIIVRINLVIRADTFYLDGVPQNHANIVSTQYSAKNSSSYICSHSKFCFLRPGKQKSSPLKGLKNKGRLYTNSTSQQWVVEYLE